jgi:sialate O-acetylesterase
MNFFSYPRSCGVALASVVVIFSPAALFADLRLPDLFSNHMVLQQGKEVPVWGSADPGSGVEVAFADAVVTTKADEKGSWNLRLPALPASAVGRALTVKCGDEEKRFEDVLVGEVWLASGQSNMQWSVSNSDNPQEEIQAGNHPGIRLFQAKMVTATEPIDNIVNTWDGWVACSPETVADFSAVAYYFGREIHQQESVPVGIIQSAWGGTRCEAWTSREALLAEPEAAEILAGWKVLETGWDEAREKAHYEQAKANWEKAVAEVKAHNSSLQGPGPRKRTPREPKPRLYPRLQHHHPSAIFNAMIHPLIPYAIRGAIWYQGESNQGRAEQYATLFPTMIGDWRACWGEDFPFLFVQLANFKAEGDAPVEEDGWPELQWSQYLTLKGLSGTGMAVANDIGNGRDIHPKNKQDVGRRLARWAMTMAPFERDITPSGPLYKGIKPERSGIRVFFDHVGEGLKTRDGGVLRGFAVAGQDRVWQPAEAMIEGATILVSSEAVTEPVAVRYAWKPNPTEANLVNDAGLPASLFRSDAWPLVTEGVRSPFEERAGRRPRVAPPVKVDG